jgi:tetratricopeptide (TPR) repeat protein
MSWLLLAVALTPQPAVLRAAGPLPPARLPITGLAPAKYVPNLCAVTYPVSTSSPQCQKFFDQGLGYFYSYVWMESARCFETATQYDPDCALAWWGLSRALEHYGHGDANKAAQKAYDLRDKASHREQQLILARMQEKGLLAGVGAPEARHRAAVATIDTLIALYDDDEEAWYYRAQLAGGAGLFGGQVSAVPFYKALLRINPLHPGANHELVHYYENSRRPALGWVYAENYIKSSPGIPHPFHMQAHLATRLGRWDKTSDRSAHAIELERAYHKEMNVAPQDDPQFNHHLEILTRSLIHDGRFREARAVKKEAWDAGIRHWLVWFRLHLAERDSEEALKVVEQFRRDDKLTAAYLAALVYLQQGDVERATPEVETLQHAYHDRKNDRDLEMRLWQLQGVLMCRTGGVDAGLKLLARCVDRTKNDFHFHEWGGGAYFMEIWGIEALHGDRPEVAEEAFLEALAHDPGSVRGAMGMQVLCERQGRAEEARRFAELARKCWSRADAADFAAELAAMRGPGEASHAAGVPTDATRKATPRGTEGTRRNFWLPWSAPGASPSERRP